MEIIIQNLSKSYQNHQALKNIYLKIGSGKIYGLLGPNGAGKTSLIRIITQITQADEGEILLNGETLGSKHIKQIGYLPEERGLYKKMTVGDQLLYFAQLKDFSLKEAKKQLKYWVERFEINDWLSKKTEELSKGMQQKIQFIATVINKPNLLILDEPFSGFDPINSQIIVDEIKVLKKNGTTIIFSTHRMDSVELLCDDICLINKSVKLLEGPINEIKANFKTNSFKINFSGILSQNLTNCEVTFINNNTAVIKPINNQTNNQILMQLLAEPIDIIAFKEQLPTIEEIFINSVNNATNA